MDGLESTRKRRRGPRDWLVDIGLFLFAVALGLITANERALLGDDGPWFAADQVAGVVACVAVWWRRRHPVVLAGWLIAASTVFEIVGGAMLVAVFTVAVHRPPRTTGLVFAASVVAAGVFSVVRSEPGVPAIAVFAFGVVVQAAAVGWGLVVHHRRALVSSLRERAVRAESEARLRAERAQRATRDEIAREIHDALGHRLSLLSVHAGALEYRTDAPRQDVARSARVIRESAHQALQDLRDVIGVLRAPVGEVTVPTLPDVRALVGESRDAGADVRLREDVDADVAEPSGRAAYRIVQEGLTNARKHAPNAPVSVSLSIDDADRLVVEVENAAPTRPGVTTSGSGRGLVGLSERVTLLGGRLEHGPTSEGGWRLAAWLPCRS